MAKCIMVQGTMSNVGKSIITAALCRIFAQDGLRVCPFKSQNMALNSFVTEDGREMSRAQVLQAEAAGIKPDVRMNPILLKPTGDMKSQVIVNGEVLGNCPAKEYFKMKKSLVPKILSAYNSLAEKYDVIVIEGAGSPAEINLREDDIVNMGLAELVDAPVILVGDIDPGGVFAQLYGTMELLNEKERKRIIGTVINKFRGDISLLKPGLSQLEALTGVPVLGVLPYMKLDLDEEDSLGISSETPDGISHDLDICVIRLPHISNYTDITPLTLHPAMGIRYADSVRTLGKPNLIILPGTKNTIADLKWLKDNGLYDAILSANKEGTAVLGICGGYQMLGEVVSDPLGVESDEKEECEGLGLLPVKTVLKKEKTKCQSRAKGVGAFEGVDLLGYQIHNGSTQVSGARAFCILDDGKEEGAVCGNVYGTYLHGVFDSGKPVSVLADLLLNAAGKEPVNYKMENAFDHRKGQLDALAFTVRSSLDMDEIRRYVG